MDIGVVSVRYARALVMYSENCGQLDAAYEAMVKLRSSLLDAPEFKSALSAPVLGDEEKKRLLMIASGIEDNACIERFFDLVLSKNRIEMMLFITQAFVDLYRSAKNVVLCQLISSSELDATVVDRIRSVVEEKTDKKVEMQQVVDASIIGGFILEYDSRCLDASVRGALLNIRKQLVNGHVDKVKEL